MGIREIKVKVLQSKINPDNYVVSFDDKELLFGRFPYLFSSNLSEKTLIESFPRRLLTKLKDFELVEATILVKSRT